MVASAPQTQSQSQSQSQSQPPSAEEEALKRNTDCVYFLASPLTCKKGSECEYRHSDIARVNPRDCWYWLHGNCLNPKCGFRHPPLDGLMGTQVPTSTGPPTPSAPSAPISQAATGPASHVPNASTKQAVPCIFFQKGYCLKGDWCPFLHAPNSANTKAISVPVTTSAVEPANIKKPFSGVEKPVQQKATPVNVAKSLNDTTWAKPLAEVESAARNESAVSRRAPQTSGTTLFSGYRTATPVPNGNPVSWSSRAQQSHLLDEPESMNSKDTEEVSREPSPGFDVLVDDEGRDSEFYPGEDRYGMSVEHEPGTEYEIGRSAADYSLMGAGDDDRYQDPHGYDSFEHHKGQYAWEQHGASSERMPGGSYRERRLYGRPESLGQVDEQDLRHRLAKHKKPNGLRSVISHEHGRDMHVRDRNYQGLHRDEHRSSSRENSLGSRLRGRIRLPGRSSSPNNRDMIRSTGRISSHQGRIGDRIKGRSEEAFDNGVKNYRGADSRRDFIGENNANFASPKSLSELKNQKNPESISQHVTDQHSLGKRKHLMTDRHQLSGSDLSFDGPKPLEEILKRKRRETSGTIVGRNSSSTEGVIGEKKEEERGGVTDESIGYNKEVDKSTSVQTMEAGEMKPASASSDLHPVASKLEAEDGILGEDGVDPESEPYEQRDGESDYEPMGGEDYVMYDGENGDAVGEYVDEEEDDEDFAKKMGVMYS
ncbi:hypothetical protein C2S51_005626 [Perilla frutescens var. frutescens]|nr:hypothetical protein C2S51_005626 [Perilla frutescens var. frutescens]